MKETNNTQPGDIKTVELTDNDKRVINNVEEQYKTLTSALIIPPDKLGNIAFNKRTEE